MEEQVSRLPSTAREACPLANVEDCSVGLSKATFFDSTSTSVSSSEKEAVFVYVIPKLLRQMSIYLAAGQCILYFCKLQSSR